MNTKRLQCAFLLRELAWSLKTYADRIERACTAPSYDNELKATVWLERAVERWLRFAKARTEYMGRESAGCGRLPVTQENGRFDPGTLRHLGNPWRAGLPPYGYGRYNAVYFYGPGKVWAPSREIIPEFAEQSVPVAWRPA